MCEYDDELHTAPKSELTQCVFRKETRGKSKNEKKKHIEEREEKIDVEEREKERERGSSLRRQRPASPTAQVLVAQTTQPVQKNRLRDEL